MHQGKDGEILRLDDSAFLDSAYGIAGRVLDGYAGPGTDKDAALPA
jgi:hypothetical protein